MTDRNSLHGRLSSIGIGTQRLATLGISPAEAKPNALTPEGINPEAIQRQAAREQTKARADQAVSDLATWRAYRDAPNPFARASLRATNSAAIERGRSLDKDPDPEPPNAA